MIKKHPQRVLALAILTTGLVAGVFYCFSVAINPALAKVNDAHYLDVTQQINIVIQNPIFFLSFFGAVIMLPLAAYAFKQSDRRRYNLLVLASVLYIVGGFGVTSFGNIPLNNQLAKVPVATASQAELAKARRDVVGRWNAWHTVRTLSSIAAFAAVTAAAVLPEAKGKRMNGE